ncbi:alpha/beta hydrolase [Glutamicibacter sp. PS]|uniref:alpha/beta hydrolase n=1 Tax=Glutamicibacter sp. PS TaxID=3075634 RepID=UPI002846D2F9|nr:alpha/beta hydrolase [Glutamicibacter sp. PS]MDR4533488.1 alpha/beta hydrolase [Glutamicibacter sp. PS]
MNIDQQTLDSPTGFHPAGLIARCFPLIMRLRRSNRHYVTREHVRRHLEQLIRTPQSIDPPRRLRRTLNLAPWNDGPWPGYVIRPATREPRGSVIYLHGGAWAHQAAPQHWSLMQSLAERAGVQVIMPIYPLAQHGGTASSVVPPVADMCESFEGPIVLMGDSAGGSIAMSASLLLKNRGNPVAATVLISPALDLRFSNPEIDAVQPHDPWLMKKGLLELAEMWIREDIDDPVLCPFLGDFAGLNQILLFSGTFDIFNPDTRLFVRAARAAGVQVDYFEGAGQLYVYPLLPVPEARAARALIVTAVREACDA